MKYMKNLFVEDFTRTIFVLQLIYVLLQLCIPNNRFGTRARASADVMSEGLSNQDVPTNHIRCFVYGTVVGHTM